MGGSGRWGGEGCGGEGKETSGWNKAHYNRVVSTG